MWIKQHLIKTKKNQIYVDLEINNIQWANDSIGWYEYGSAREYDDRPDYIESFDIDEIYINGKKVEHKLIFSFLLDILINDDELFNRLENIIKEEAVEMRVEEMINA